MGDRGPPSSGPGWGTLRACASLQLGAEALTAPVLPCHREPSWGVDSFLPGSWAATQPLPLALLVRTPPRYCECAPPGDEAGVPAAFSALPGHGPLLLASPHSRIRVCWAEGRAGRAEAMLGWGYSTQSLTMPPCCSLGEQRPEPALGLKGAVYCAPMIVPGSMPSGHSWGGTCSLPRFTAYPSVRPHGNKQDIPDQQQSLNFTPSLQ